MKVARYLFQKGTRQVALGSSPTMLYSVALNIPTLLCLLLLSAPSLVFCQSQGQSQKPSSRPPKIEVPKENETGEPDADKEETQKESEAQRSAAEPVAASQANPMAMPEYPTEIVGIVKSIKPFPLEKVRLNEDVPSNSVFLEIRISIDKAVPVAGNHEAVVEPGAEVALITRDPITQQWVGKKLTGLVRLQGDTSGQQRFLSKSKLVTKKSGTEHSK